MSDLISMLYIMLIFLIFLVIVLVIVFIALRKKEKEKENSNKSKKVQNSNTAVALDKKAKIAKQYDTKSVFDFMEFEGVKDNMIVQKNGKRFLMAIECQGVNYDLMSEIEKTSIEQGFSSFLNTLREPIQIYIQTRTVNLEKNIQDYKQRLTKIKDDLDLKEYRLKQYMQQRVNEKTLENRQFDVLREENLYEYGRDIIADTERMSLNKNVLRKNYYIIIKYFYEPIDVDSEDVMSDEEIREAAFANLYTRASSIIRVLSGIGIVGRALNSFELVDLLYNAYNRDDSEVFGIEKAIEAGFNEIYVDSQNIIDKKIEALNKEIEAKAQKEAQEAINQVVDEREKELKNLEKNIDSVIENLAKQVIEENERRLTEEIREKAIEKIEKKHKKKGEETNGQKQTKETVRKRRAG